jgi:hypothetical protein
VTSIGPDEMVTIPRKHLAALIFAAGTGDDTASWRVAELFEEAYASVVTDRECEAAYREVQTYTYHKRETVTPMGDGTLLADCYCGATYSVTAGGDEYAKLEAARLQHIREREESDD